MHHENHHQEARHEQEQRAKQHVLTHHEDDYQRENDSSEHESQRVHDCNVVLVVPLQAVEKCAICAAHFHAVGEPHANLGLFRLVEVPVDINASSGFATFEDVFVLFDRCAAALELVNVLVNVDEDILLNGQYESHSQKAAMRVCVRVNVTLTVVFRGLFIIIILADRLLSLVNTIFMFLMRKIVVVALMDRLRKSADAPP